MGKKSTPLARPDIVDWWSDLVAGRFPEWADEPFFGDRGRMLRVEEVTDKNELVVRAEMPGVDPDKDVQIHVRNHVLEIRVERKESREHKEKDTTRSEFRYGSMYRAIPLPPDVDDTNVVATYKDGILEVRMPHDEKHAETTKIEIKRT